VENNRVNFNPDANNPYPYFDSRGIGTPNPYSEPAHVDVPPPFQPVPSPTPVYPVSTGPFYSREDMPTGDVPTYPVGAGNLGGDFLLNLIFVGFLWELWICLYPLSALAGLFTLVYALPYLRGVLPVSPIIGPGLYAVVLGCGAALVALWSASRLEQVLARHSLYRIIRHVARLPLLGMAAVVAIQKAHGLPYDPTLTGITPILETPANVAIVIGVMIAFHFILWNWKGARDFWHRRLAGARLRSCAD
jgi:hypothetical protein